MKKIIPLQTIKKSGTTRIFIFKNNVKIETYYNLNGRWANLIIDDKIVARNPAGLKEDIFNRWSDYLI